MFLYQQNPRVRKCNRLQLEIIRAGNLELRKALGFHPSLDEETGLLFCREGIIIVPFYGKVFTCVVVFGSVDKGDAGLFHSVEIVSGYSEVHFSLILTRRQLINEVVI